MQTFNINNLDANEITNEIISADEYFTRVGVNNMELGDVAKAVVDRWLSLDYENRDRERQLRGISYLYAALAYMGHYNSVRSLALHNYIAGNKAERNGDTKAHDRFVEEANFWENIFFGCIKSDMDKIDFAYYLLYGIGVPKDIDRSVTLYAKLFDEKCAVLNEVKREKLRKAREGTLTCPMSEMRKRAVDVILKEDRDEFIRLMYESIDKGNVEDVYNALYMVSYVEQIGEK